MRSLNWNNFYGAHASEDIYHRHSMRKFAACDENTLIKMVLECYYVPGKTQVLSNFIYIYFEKYNIIKYWVPIYCEVSYIMVKQIDWPSHSHGFIISVDATDFCAQEPTPFNPKFSDFKLGVRGLRYEFSMSIYIEKANEFIGNWPQVIGPISKLFKDRFDGMLHERQKIMADRGYPHRSYIHYIYIIKGNITITLLVESLDDMTY